ncbi:hypothetical protein SCLCIDRAFT_1213884 [Scleroderma citrinum Foug A]|uniref:Uncharacterized protein n=1 Tax=Scleroderma citrinum Foug A TaxID=1036808 RepID=A0A0C3DTU4_9AGAM|nr:hypothetical protein SCLCIDRAFT_1213884 [Scleroderma citrinum Foug A]
MWHDTKSNPASWSESRRAAINSAAHVAHLPPYYKWFYPPMTSHLSPPYKHPTHVPQPPYISSTYSPSHSFDTAH